MADARWFKTKLGEIRRMLLEGHIEAALLLADATSGLPRAFRPSQDPDQTEAMIRERVARESPRLIEMLARIAGSKANG